MDSTSVSSTSPAQLANVLVLRLSSLEVTQQSINNGLEELRKKIRDRIREGGYRDTTSRSIDLWYFESRDRFRELGKSNHDSQQLSLLVEQVVEELTLLLTDPIGGRIFSNPLLIGDEVWEEQTYHQTREIFKELTGIEQEPMPHDYINWFKNWVKRVFKKDLEQFRVGGAHSQNVHQTIEGIIIRYLDHRKKLDEIRKQNGLRHMARVGYSQITRVVEALDQGLNEFRALLAQESELKQQILYGEAAQHVENVHQRKNVLAEIDSRLESLHVKIPALEKEIELNETLSEKLDEEIQHLRGQVNYLRRLTEDDGFCSIM